MGTVAVLSGDQRLAKPSRTYASIWERLKREKNCVLEVHPINVGRLKKAIIKEKDHDRGFKLLNEDDPPRLRFSYDKAKRRLTVRLLQTLGIEDIIT